MTFFPLPSLKDNYIWISKDKDQSKIWVVDPGDENVVLDYCRSNKVTVVGILITHYHWDHTDGVAAIVQQYKCPVYGPSALYPKIVTHPLKEGDSLTVNETEFTVLETPGHTLDHICYFGETPASDPILLCGDTLFRGGCGRLLGGDHAQLLNAMTRIRELPRNTDIYCSHEYTLANYRFASSLEPDNEILQQANLYAKKTRELNQPTLPTTLELELQTNPFLRFDIPDVISNAAKQLNEAPALDLVGAFAQIRRAKDSF